MSILVRSVFTKRLLLFGMIFALRKHLPYMYIQLYSIPPVLYTPEYLAHASVHICTHTHTHPHTPTHTHPHTPTHTHTHTHTHSLLSPSTVPAHSHHTQSTFSHGTTQHTSAPTVPSLPHTPPPKPPHPTSSEEGTSPLTNGTVAGKFQDLETSDDVNLEKSKESPSYFKTPTTRSYQPLKLGNVQEVIPSYAELEYHTHTEPFSSKNGTNEPDSFPDTSAPHLPATKARGMSEPRSSTSSIDANSLGNLALEITSLQMNAKYLEGRTSALEAGEERTTEQMSSLQTELSKLVTTVEQLVEKQEAMDSDIKRLKKKLDAVSQQGANGTVKAQGQGEVRNIKERNKQYLSSLTSKQVSKHVLVAIYGLCPLPHTAYLYIWT